MNRVLCTLAAAVVLFGGPAFAQQSAPKPQTLLTNVNVFDGKNEGLINRANVLVEGNLIMKDGKIYKNSIR